MSSLLDFFSSLAASDPDATRRKGLDELQYMMGGEDKSPIFGIPARRLSSTGVKQGMRAQGRYAEEVSHGVRPELLRDGMQ